MGFVFLGIIWLVIGIGLLVFLIQYLEIDNGLLVLFCVIVPAMIFMGYGLNIAGYELDGSYALIQDSNGNYVTRKENGEYVVTINENGVPSIYSFSDLFSDLKIVPVETDENAQLEVVKRNWSIEITVYIPKS